MFVCVSEVLGCRTGKEQIDDPFSGLLTEIFNQSSLFMYSILFDFI